MTIPGMSARGSLFPVTRHSVVARLGSDRPELCRAAFETLVTAYWKPVFKYLRLKWRADPEEAADLTQAFFLRVYEKRYLARFDPGQARFRTYLRVCLDRFVANDRQRGGRLKRGGGTEVVSLDFGGAERELRLTSEAGADYEELFHREWIRALFGLAVDRLRSLCAANGRQVRFAAFERYDLAADDWSRPTYASLARDLDITVGDVTNELAAARRDLRRLVLDALREQSTSEEEFQAEVRALMST